jgi:hypothetical protein
MATRVAACGSVDDFMAELWFIMMLRNFYGEVQDFAGRDSVPEEWLS